MVWQELLTDAALAILTIAALAFAMAGMVLCLRPWDPPDPGTATRSAPGLLGLLETPRRIERFVYRHHRLSGAAIMLGAGFFIWRIASSGVLWSRGIDFQAPLLWLLGGAIVLAFMVGLVILIRPSGLKPVEVWANRWMGPDPGTLREWLNRHPRVLGLLVMSISLYALMVFGRLLIQRTAQWLILAT